MEQIKGNIASPKGFYADGKHAGLKRKRNDIGWIYSEVPAESAAVYTMNQMQAAPIFVTKDSFASDAKLQAIIVNSGNANACTGNQGMLDALTMRAKTAENLQIPVESVAVASTGIIGDMLPMDKIIAGIDMLEKQSGNAADFEEAILTTDTFQKQITFQIELSGKTVTMSGVAKGSGMIHPNMATMLAFITTDAAIPAELLQKLLKKKVDKTFNQITVDGDTSTNDMVVVMANGCAENPIIQEGTADWEKLAAMFQAVTEHLAKSIARDGEGATKLIEVQVNGATKTEDARMIAKKIVSSSLVKTAAFGGDGNWGRIICAIGYSGGRFAPDNITIKIGGIEILNHSSQTIFNQQALDEYLEEEHIVIEVDLHIGLESGTAWGCDLSYEYVKINACYRT
ncbi:bifunctional glutamate N-acetyltransferase/amino-acid acetyltransferase ArgJ [Listeria ivanovii]|uniref:Arginine biosynthesis bifunctional protein ArgJ n=1 Tax=Listeria ivanovii (strain ATCC BAA-678 / PAM 55) TaxID=881621 RepID=G2Z9T1_LISIP|nr:bifunctional glutamate N-acetyltransferase/amino-acid acetyltransferase ArgJ [Listeria ivanovii]MCJ1717343.1 bifunctional glutamate N-acetyltransferase/amino-acid acetyltransferase ArgJ [Listeria ivanovii]MCJ1722893.1 bifunctional glutamate N-acetyltransferase/amino-acid acetyltransferase ArgJ [Listeria ivanovii]MCJ1735573.1 bifunctional glutamate N-acetyltransferase/amino-acid acetyltransferase ArgJ [Listeria ivanovii]CBW86030.1 Putative ornithine/amino-acid acetyltransferase [Listeria ivan